MKSDRTRMEAAVGAEEVSLLPAKGASWGVKIGADYGGGSEKQGIVVTNRLANLSVGKIIAKMTSKTQFNAVNNKSTGKSWLRTLQNDGSSALRPPQQQNGVLRKS